MKPLYTVTPAIEAGAGLALGFFPSAAVAMLLGTGLDTSAAVTLGRLAGAALLALGVACWLARNDAGSGAATGLVTGMLVYNAAVVLLFIFAAFGLGLHGVALWPAVVLHAAMTVWCFACLQRRPVAPSTKAQNQTHPQP
jgi:hypothetical protein